MYKEIGDQEKANHYQLIHQKKLAEKDNIDILTQRHLDLLKAHLQTKKTKTLAQAELIGIITLVLALGLISYKYYKNRQLVRTELNRIIRTWSKSA